MARGLHRFMDADLRFGMMSARYFRAYRKYTSSGSVSLPRGNFRFSVFGGGGGGAFYKSTGTTQNTTGVFSGNFGIACGGRGGIAIFDVHIPHYGMTATLTIGAGGAGKTASATTAAGTGGQSKVVISDLGVTVTANGGAGGKAGASKANCTPGAGGTVSYTGVTAVASASGIAALIQYDDGNWGRDCYGRNYLTKLDYSTNSAIDMSFAMHDDAVSLYHSIGDYLPKNDRGAYGVYGIGGMGQIAVEQNLSTNKYIVSGYVLGGDWTTFAETTNGEPGLIMIERL